MRSTPDSTVDDALALFRATGRRSAGLDAPAEFHRVATEVRDWPGVLALARAHRMVSLAGARLDELPAGAWPAGAWPAGAWPAGAWPAGARDAWRIARLESAAAGLAAAGELARVTAVLRDAGLEALAYKGPALAVVAYGDAGARPCTDLDLVVPPREYGRARAALLRGGFASRLGLSRTQECVLLGGQGHADFARSTGGAPFVELHWRFAAHRLPWSPSVLAVRSRAERVRVGGVDVLAPGREDQLLLLALHGTRHGWEQFEWLVALGVLLQRGAIDGDAVLRRARAVGGGRALLLGTELASRVLGVTVPDAFRRAAIADPAVDVLACAAIARWHAPVPWSVAVEHGFERACLERRRDHVRRALASTFLPTPREWEALRLPAMLTPLYVPIRLARLARRAATDRGPAT